MPVGRNRKNRKGIHQCIQMIWCKYHRPFGRNILLPEYDVFTVKLPESKVNILSGQSVGEWKFVDFRHVNRFYLGSLLFQ